MTKVYCKKCSSDVTRSTNFPNFCWNCGEKVLDKESGCASETKTNPQQQPETEVVKIAKLVKHLNDEEKEREKQKKKKSGEGLNFMHIAKNLARAFDSIFKFLLTLFVIFLRNVTLAKIIVFLRLCCIPFLEKDKEWLCALREKMIQKYKDESSLWMIAKIMYRIAIPIICVIAVLVANNQIALFFSYSTQTYIVIGAILSLTA